MTVRRFMPMIAVLIAAGLVLAQTETKQPPNKDAPAKKEPAKPAPGSLEDTLEKSLRNSADIKAAEAKVREAEAELNRVRHQVLAKATALHNELNQAKRMLRLSEDIVGHLRDGVAKGVTTHEAFLTAQTAVEKNRGEVEKIEAELKSLRGEFAIKNVNYAFTFTPVGGTVLYGATAEGTVRVWDAADGRLLNTFDNSPWFVDGAAKAPAVQASMMERIKKLLDKEVELELGGESIQMTMQLLLEAVKSDIPFRSLPLDQAVHISPLKGKLAVGAWLQALEDSDPNVCIVIRDYGLLLTARDRRPEGALRVQDLWKGNYAELKKPETKAPEKK